jgi:acylphosphatase
VSARQFRVRGRVQGVGFRAFVVRRARELGVAGAVRNEEDGSVTAVASGTDEALAALRAALAGGPPRAAVTAVDEEALAGLPSGGFDIRF